jgi:D-alanyl-D-alanine carboxypeptidase-like protein
MMSAGAIRVLGGILAVVVSLWATPPFAQSVDAVVPVTPARCAHMKQHRVFNPGAPVACDRLRLLTFGYVGFDGQLRGDAEMVVMDAVADHVLQIFVALRERRFPIGSVKLMDHYNGDDDASTAANNTSALNVRPVSGGGGRLSLHAYGVAIDLNPLQNPYIVRSGGAMRIDPPSATAYVNRRNLRPGMAESVIDVFAAHGFVEWGGRWPNPVDYQHFQVGRGLAYELARMPAPEARAAFERFVQRSRSGRSGVVDRERTAQPK